MRIKDGFDSDMEQTFLQSKHFLDPLYIRGIFIVFILLYGLFGFLDFVYFPESIKSLLIIRFAIVIPIFSISIILTYTKYFYNRGKRYCLYVNS